MKKRIIIGIFSTLLLCTSSAGAIDIKDLSISWEKPRIFTVKGVSDSGMGGEKVSFQVLNPDKSMREREPGENPPKDYFVRLYQTETDENGEFTFSFDIENATTKTGEFTLRVKNAAENKEVTEIKFNYASEDVLNTTTEKLSACMGKKEKDDEAVSKISNMLRTEVKNVYFIDFPLYDGVVGSEAIADMSEYLSYMEQTDDGEQMMKNIRLAAVIASAQNDIISSSQLLDEYADDLKISKSPEYAVYSGYSNTYKEKFDTLFRTQKTGQMLDAEKYVNAFKNSVVLTELSKANGSKAVDETLSRYRAYFNMTKYDASKYKDELCNKIAKGFENNSIKNIEDVQKLLDTQITSTNTSNNGGSSSGRGGSSPGVGSAMPGYLTEKINNTEKEPDNVVNTQIKSAFTDIDSVEWARTEIEYLAETGVLSGYSNEIFAPNDKLTRAQACKILCKVFSLNEEHNQNIFSDVKDEWYKGFVMGAYKSGIVNGYSETVFGAEDCVTRQDFVVMLMRALDKYEVHLTIQKDDAAAFTDADKISDYALEGVENFKNASIISGKDDGRFDPLGNITRAEAAKIIYKVKNIYEGR